MDGSQDHRDSGVHHPEGPPHSGLQMRSCGRGQLGPGRPCGLGSAKPSDCHRAAPAGDENWCEDNSRVPCDFLLGNMFLPVEMPERFVLEFLTDDGSWMDHGLFESATFVRDRDGSYVAATGGSPMILRCLRQDGAVVYAVDGGGEPYTYRLVPFPGGGYSVTS